MVDITHKNTTLRIATAQALVKVGHTDTLEAIRKGTVPKGNVLEMSRAAGLLAIKKTPDILPDCHPLPIEFAQIEYALEEKTISIQCTIKTIYKTGVEVEAMHGASVVALNVYDMLKPIDKNIEIQNIKLLQKKGGKSDHPLPKIAIKTAVIVCSDSISQGKNKDKAGKEIIELLKPYPVIMSDYQVIPDEVEAIQTMVQKQVAQEVALLLFTGGTGLGPRDQTPEALIPLLDRRVPGIEEAIRSYGQNRTTYAMLSRSVAGFMGNTLILAVPGSTVGARESIHAIFPAVLHVFDILKGNRH
ncbi:bifunctional molybdenum cofactor biosynthesis protein MoaC/MoaB [Croceiramulus getboli]|nr:bifunctional molybdenum cofactor biosynthesis protein MoaC/MoaB [Flavobacteriaceae bacterium YJPT1-3]